MPNTFSFAHQVDDATSLDDLKRRLRAVLHQIESTLAQQTDIHFIDAQTNSDPSQFKSGDIIADASIIEGAIVLYAFDAKKNKILLSLRGLAGTLPLSENEIFVGNGTIKNFNTQVAFNARSTQVYKGGLRQQLGTDYVENSSTYKQIQFIVAPTNGAIIIVDYEMATVI